MLIVVQLEQPVTECVWFSVTLKTRHADNHVISETSLYRQSIALALTTKNKETKQYIHQKHKRETEKLS